MVGRPFQAVPSGRAKHEHTDRVRRKVGVRVTSSLVRPSSLRAGRAGKPSYFWRSLPEFLRPVVPVVELLLERLQVVARPLGVGVAGLSESCGAGDTGTDG